MNAFPISWRKWLNSQIKIFLCICSTRLEVLTMSKVSKQLFTSKLLLIFQLRVLISLTMNSSILCKDSKARASTESIKKKFMLYQLFLIRTYMCRFFIPELINDWEGFFCLPKNINDVFCSNKNVIDGCLKQPATPMKLNCEVF